LNMEQENFDNYKTNNSEQPKILTFPSDFLWGVATSSHQVEGGNTNNDWYEWEKKGKTSEESGIACDSWNRYEEDNNLVKDLGCNAYRFSLEWSRIEPQEGQFSNEAIEHYRKILLDMKQKGIKRVITLNHWTLPLWFSKKYGWHKKESVEKFSVYCRKVMEGLGAEMDMIITLNEPRLTINRGYGKGDFPPGKKNPFLYLRARKNLIKAHKASYKIVKKIRSDLPCGITQYVNDFDWLGKGKAGNWITEKIEDFYNWKIFQEIGENQDFIGLNYYSGYEISFRRPFVKMKAQNEIRSDFGWGFSPEGIHEVIMDAWKKFKKPIYIFENGAADAEDKIRAKYIAGHLKWIHEAIEEGADVRGYFHWSLLDNFEWNAGYSMKFGLYEVDRNTMERKVRGSAMEYANICKSNELEI